MRGRVRAGEIRNKPDKKGLLGRETFFLPIPVPIPQYPLRKICVYAVSFLDYTEDPSHHKNGHDTSLLPVGKVPGKKGNIVKSTV